MGMFKMIKKILLIFILVFMLCGCSVEYNVTLDDETFKETGFLIEKKENKDYVSKNGFTFEKQLDYTYQSMHDILNGQETEKTQSFELKKIDTDKEIGLNYSNELEQNNYFLSPILRQCYDGVSVKNNNSYIKISTGNYFKCFDYYELLDNVTVNFTTNYKVVSNNADEIKENTYTWFINKNNYKTKEIAIQIDKSVVSNNTTLDEKESNILTIFLIGTLLVAIFIFGFYTYYKVKFSNN